MNVKWRWKNTVLFSAENAWCLWFFLWVVAAGNTLHDHEDDKCSLDDDDGDDVKYVYDDEDDDKDDSEIPILEW